MSESKRFKRQSTTLEYLPNELFVEIFGYLNGVDTVYAFSQLNNRLENLLHNYATSFDFTSVSKAKFNFVTQQHNTYQWRSLRLSDDDHTPGQIRFFCQLFPPATNICQLESLTVLNMTSKFTSEFLLQIGSFKNLTFLSIGTVCGFDTQLIELPSLKQLIVTSCKSTAWIMNFRCLENLQHTIKYSCNHTHQFVFPTTLTRLKIFYEESRDGDALRTAIRQLSQLTKLALYDNARYSPLPNGQIWEELIVSSFPLLNTFQFYFPFESYRHTSNDLNQTVDSFSTPFYLIQKRWFIRCDRNPKSLFLGAIYSLPFAFSHMPINTCSFSTSLSTLPLLDANDIKSIYYTKVKTLVFNKECEIPHLGFLGNNIEHLILMVNLPRCWIYLLTKLRHITIGSYVEMTTIDFETLLRYSPNLQHLTISSDKLKKLTDKFTNQTICNQLSEKIRSLTMSYQYFDVPTLDTVSVRSLTSLVRIFSTKLEHLSLALIAQPKTVRPILRRMKALRSLHVEWSPSYINFDDPITAWLQQISTDHTAVDFVHTIDKRHLFIWFGNQF